MKVIYYKPDVQKERLEAIYHSVHEHNAKERKRFRKLSITVAVTVLVSLAAICVLSQFVKLAWLSIIFGAVILGGFYFVLIKCPNLRRVEDEKDFAIRFYEIIQRGEVLNISWAPTSFCLLITYKDSAGTLHEQSLEVVSTTATKEVDDIVLDAEKGTIIHPEISFEKPQFSSSNKIK
jgi:hypothetical protein